MTYDLEAEEDLLSDIREFRDQYLLAALAKAQRDGVDSRVAAFALLECVQLVVDNCYDAPDEALRVGEQLIEGFLKDWRSSRRLSSSAH